MKPSTELHIATIVDFSAGTWTLRAGEAVRVVRLSAESSAAICEVFGAGRLPDLAQVFDHFRATLEAASRQFCFTVQLDPAGRWYVTIAHVNSGKHAAGQGSDFETAWSAARAAGAMNA